MDIFQAIILGIIQGLTEFLPVSSTGHLVIFEKIFGKEPSLFFDTMLHAGTLIAVIVVLWKDIWEILKKPFQKLTLFLILATIPAVIASLVFDSSIKEIFKSAQFLGLCFLITTVFLVTAELLSRKYAKSDNNENLLKNAENMTWLDALIIGIMQAIAIPPGISRSGATISGGIFRKLNRDLAARFAFLMSIPAIMGAVVFQTKDLFDGKTVENEIIFSPVAVIIGTLTAAIVGFFAVKFMLKIIREKSLFGFAVYTGVLGLFCLFDQFVTGILF